jgi:hypothetical protein
MKKLTMLLGTTALLFTSMFAPAGAVGQTKVGVGVEVTHHRHHHHHRKVFVGVIVKHKHHDEPVVVNNDRDRR